MGLRVARRLVAGAVAGLAAGLLTVSVAAPAAAGGPTSVVLSLPGSGRVSVLHVGSADYEALAALVGAYASVPGPAESAAGSAAGSAGAWTAERHDQGPVLRLTWLIHDVEPWRLDEVYLLASKGPWISTRTTNEAGDTWGVPQVWHRSADGDQLKALVARLGLDPTATGMSSAESSGAGSAGAGSAGAGSAGAASSVGSDPAAGPSASRVDPAGADRPGSAASSAASGASGFAGWVWGIVGLMAGAVLTLAGEQAWSRRRRGTPAIVERTEPGGPAERAEPADAPVAELELDPVVLSRR